ncbi:MAG: radical SAM protein, partial [Candidatus Anstonellales archaeon]
LSSTHDPYLPELAEIARRILEVSLPAGVRYCIQTRSLLVRNDFDLLTKYKEQVRLQVSIATLNNELASIIEPRVALPDVRLRLLREAKSKGLEIGVIIAPIFPVKGWLNDLENIFKELACIGVDNVYGEILHVRGSNLEYLKEVGLLNDDLNNNNNKKKDKLLRFDRLVGKHFNALMHRYNMKGRYWYEHYYSSYY